MDDEVVVGRSAQADTDDEILRSLPPPLEFPESIEAVRDRIALAVGDVSVPKNVGAWHPAVKQLLALDNVRRNRLRAGKGYTPPRFETPFELRRLRIANAVLTAMARMNYKAHINASDIDDEQPDKGKMLITLSSYDAAFLFTLNPIDRFPRSDEINWRLASDGLQLALGRDPEFRPDGRPWAWEDSDEAPLESQLTEIVIELILKAEIDYRAYAIERYHERVGTMVKLQLRKLAAEHSEKEWLERIEQLLAVRGYRQAQVGRRRRQKGSIKDRGDGWWKVRWREYYIDAQTGVEKSTYKQELWSKKQYPTEQLVRQELDQILSKIDDGESSGDPIWRWLKRAGVELCESCRERVRAARQTQTNL